MLNRKACKAMLIAAYGLASFGSVPVLAVTNSNTANTSVGRNGAQVNAQSTTTVGNSSVSANAKVKLEGQRLERCQKRLRSIQTRLDRSTKGIEQRIATMNKINAKVQAFASAHSRKPANYASLTADVEAKHNLSTAALAKLKEAAKFSCDSPDPKQSLLSFKAALAEVKVALKAYHRSIVNLIVGVKSTKAQAEVKAGAEVKTNNVNANANANAGVNR